VSTFEPLSAFECWCLLFVLIRHAEEGATESPRWIRELGNDDWDVYCERGREPKESIL
jgi:hypothetical protein